jgi:cytochrome c oxidase cbb3-type subunit 3/ubiquinol-cytochrome c reductase cytochrome c subunit
MMRPEIFASTAVLFASLASGALECSAPARSPSGQQGATLYKKMCAVCHGAAGEGYKADQAPAIAHPAFLASVSDAFLREVIANGRGGSTMSAWSTERGGPLSRDDVDAIIGFMRGWEERPRASLDERPLMGDATRGADVYAKECARCHGAHGLGGPNVSIGHPDLLGTASDGFLRYAIRGGRVNTLMPAFGAALGDQGVDDTVALLRSWQATAGTGPRPPPAKPPPIPLGPVPLNAKGPEPEGLHVYPLTTHADDIKRELDRGARMALLDARAPSDYLNEHISGAVSVPFYDPSPYIADLPKDAWLVCYCACPHAESGNLAQALQQKGFTKVTVLDEGLGFWKRKDYGTHKGIDP